MALLKVGKVDIGNFIEGMACTGGCIGGAGCLTHGEKIKMKSINMAWKLMKKLLVVQFQ